MLKIEMFDTGTGERLHAAEAPARIAKATAEVRRWLIENNLDSYDGLRLDGPTHELGQVVGVRE